LLSRQLRSRENCRNRSELTDDKAIISTAQLLKDADWIHRGLLIRIVILELDVLTQEADSSVREEKLSATGVTTAEASSNRWVTIWLQQWVVDLYIEDREILT
jgi:ribosome-associated protein YbcJ (S4-like RNA binding protein)